MSAHCSPLPKIIIVLIEIAGARGRFADIRGYACPGQTVHAIRQGWRFSAFLFGRPPVKREGI
jgi:hypothetical protein